MRWRALGWRAAAGLAVAAAIGLGTRVWWSAPEVRAARAPGVRLSLLAVGDTGTPHRFLLDWTGDQLDVAAAMAAEDRSAPIDGLLLLGDNFYPDGLSEREFKDRLRENVVGPYCRFVALTPRGEGSLRASCPEPAALRHPVPIYAVLGNEDYDQRESPALQRERIPEYVSNWRMPRGSVEVHELPGGLSLVLFESMFFDEKIGRELGAALAGARGPWRILAAHHPMADGGGGFRPEYTRELTRILAERGAAVQLFLSGHEHNLQAIEMDPPAPPLHVIAGGGSGSRAVEPGSGSRRFGAGSLGFARVDLLAEDGAERLRVSLYTVPAHLGATGDRRLAARFSVDLAGTVSEESPTAAPRP